MSMRFGKLPPGGIKQAKFVDITEVVEGIEANKLQNELNNGAIHAVVAELKETNKELRKMRRYTHTTAVAASIFIVAFVIACLPFALAFAAWMSTV